MAQSSYQIYEVTNKVNNKIYIGKTRRSAYTRLAEHASGHCPELKADIVKYGVENFDIKILRQDISREDAISMERFHIYNASRKGKEMYNVYCTEKKQVHRTKKASCAKTSIAEPLRKLFGFDLQHLKKKDAVNISKDDFSQITKKVKKSTQNIIALELDDYDVIIVKRAN